MKSIMIKYTKKKCALVLLISTLFLVSCTNVATTSQQSNDNQVQITEDNLLKHVEFLTSDQCQGRLTGTSGNELAAQYIKTYFDEIELSFLDHESYDFSYNQKIYPVENQVHELKVVFSNNEEKSYVYGTDFMAKVPYESVSFERKPHVGIGKDPKNEFVFILSNEEEFLAMNNNLSPVMVKEDFFYKGGRVFETSSDVETNVMRTPLIQISSKLYDELSQSEIKSIYYHSKMLGQESTQNNIIGLINGPAQKQVIVISAHFDHVGTAGDTIFRGAVDNASGTALLLELAKRLKEASLIQLFESDIIIAAFNGEEEGLLGSKAFVSEIETKYDSVININLDCIGKLNGGPLLLEGDSDLNMQLLKIIVPILTESEVDYKVGEFYLSSDHESFIEKGFPSVGLIQENIKNAGESIHTLSDTSDLIDYNYLKKMINLLQKMIIAIDHQYDPTIQLYSESSEEEIAELIDTELRLKRKEVLGTLGYDETISFVIRDTYCEISGNRILDNSEYKKFYPDFKIMENMDEYYFTSILVDNNSGVGYSIEYFSENTSPEFDGLVTKRNLTFEDFVKVFLKYEGLDRNIEVEVHRYSLEQTRYQASTSFNIAAYSYEKEEQSDRNVYRLLKSDGNGYFGVCEEYFTEECRYVVLFSVTDENRISLDLSSKAGLTRALLDDLYNQVNLNDFIDQLGL